VAKDIHSSGTPRILCSEFGADSESLRGEMGVQSEEGCGVDMM